MAAIFFNMLIRLSIKFLYKFNFTYIIINWHFCSVKYSSTSIWSLFYVFIIIKYWLSMMDILYLKILLFSNDGHYVEEHQSGLHILNKVNNPKSTRTSL